MENFVVPDAIAQAAVSLLRPYIPGLKAAYLNQLLSREKEEKNKASKKLLTRKEAAALLSVSLNTLNRYLNDGLLERVRLSSHAVRISPDSLDRLLGQNTQAQNQQERSI